MAMAIPIRRSNLAICAIAALFFFVATALASVSDAPFIVAHKKVSLTRLNSGSDRLSVSIDIYNRGSVTAYDLTLTDDTWAKDVFDFVGANTSKSWERLDAGSIVSHSFELESKVKSVFHGAPAVVTFRIPTKAALQEAYSTPIIPLDLLAERLPEDKFEMAKKLLGRYGPQISVISIIALFVHLVATPSNSKAAKGSKKRR